MFWCVDQIHLVSNGVSDSQTLNMALLTRLAARAGLQVGDQLGSLISGLGTSKSWPLYMISWTPSYYNGLVSKGA